MMAAGVLIPKMKCNWRTYEQVQDIRGIPQEKFTRFVIYCIFVVDWYMSFYQYPSYNKQYIYIYIYIYIYRERESLPFSLGTIDGCRWPMVDGWWPIITISPCSIGRGYYVLPSPKWRSLESRLCPVSNVHELAIPIHVISNNVNTLNGS